MAYLRNGFQPVTMPSESQYGRFRVSAGTGESIAAGDAVVKVANALIRAGAGQDPTTPVFGVVIATYNSAGAPFTFLPNKFVASGTWGYADICTDPNVEYAVRCETSVGDSNIGNNVVINQSAPNGPLGRSGQAVEIPASASINDLFKIVRLYGGEFTNPSGGILTGSAGNGVVVKINRGTFNAATASQ